MMRFTKTRALGFACALCLVLCSSGAARSQSFSISTDSNLSGDVYSYEFTVNYGQAGAGQPLIDDIWTWSFFLEPDTSEPTDIMSPTGWLHTYKPGTGELVWYTEGPNGWASGDFGNRVIRVGESLSGFRFRTPLEPGLSLAFAYDTQFNFDANAAILPTTLAIPEPGTWALIGCGAFNLGLMALRRCYALRH